MALPGKAKKGGSLESLPDKIPAEDVKKYIASWGRESKFGNKTTVKHGKTFQSQREADRYTELLLLRSAGRIMNIRTQVPYTLIPKSKYGPKIVYIADFVYFDIERGEKVVEDAKGVRTKEYRLKKRLMAERHGIIIKEV